jgi:hypothetical protein
MEAERHFNAGTWNVQEIGHKDEQLDELLN